MSAVILQNIPRHIALIPDGNRRWAKEKGLPTLLGHQKGFEKVRQIGRRARELGVPVFSVWAFSTENWKRTKEEVGYLMNLYVEKISEYIKEAIEEEIQIIHIGRKDRIPERLKKKIEEAETKTKKYSKFYFVIALDYGGRDEVVRALSRIKKTPITEEDLSKHLDTKDLPYPEPDLIIRTSGEQRTSGFMIWQSAYSELCFVPEHLPDFTVGRFEEELVKYTKRSRRFGK